MFGPKLDARSYTTFLLMVIAVLLSISLFAQPGTTRPSVASVGEVSSAGSAVASATSEVAAATREVAAANKEIAAALRQVAAALKELKPGAPAAAPGAEAPTAAEEEGTVQLSGEGAEAEPTTAADPAEGTLTIN